MIKDAESSLAVTTICCDLPTEVEVAKAIRRLKPGKAPGICGIPTELLKAGDNVVVKRLTAVIRGVCGRQARSQSHLIGERASSFRCIKVKVVGESENYRGIIGKMSAFTLLSCIKAMLESMQTC